jgi:hypothetical protein
MHAHVMEFLAALDARGDKRFALSSFGTSPGGRDLPLVVMSAAPKKQVPTVMIINGIHAGEVEGKEASMMLMRDILDGTHAELLEHLRLVVVPLFNPDGNDAVDPKNRVLNVAALEGQDGPPLVGTRVNKSGINLNRDYMRQGAPEMRALQSQVVQKIQPDLTIDCHATNGSVHRFAMTYDIPHTVETGRAEPIEFMRSRVMPAVTTALEKQHALLAGWYGNFVEDERALDARRTADPAAPVSEGWMTYTHHPRFGSNYRGLTNRCDLLLECYSYLSFPDRVKTTYATLLETLRYVAAHGDDVVQVVAASRAPRDRIAIRYKLDAFDGAIDIPTRTPRTLEGAPSIARVRHFAKFAGTAVVARPPAYVVDAQVAAHLARHGLALTDAPAAADVEVATATGYGSEGGRKILESATVGDLHVSWARGSRSLPPGAKLVKTDQPLGAIAVYLCEPESDDGAIENGLVAAPEVGGEFPIWRAF